MALDTAFITLRDYSNETATLTINTVPVTAANFAAQMTALGALETQVNAITDGAISRSGVTHTETLTRDIPTDPRSQRELKWLVTYYDNTEWLDAPTNTIINPSYQRAFNVEIPCAKLDIADEWLLPQSDRVDLAQDPWPAFLTAFEAFAKSPNGGTPQVIDVRLIGRSL
jgi:hypothetical protein